MQSDNFKDWCRDLRIKGHTLGEISKITKRPKTTVYFHIKEIPPTKRLLEKIRKIRTDSIKGKGPKKGKSLLNYKFKNFEKWRPFLVNLVAHMMFDGAIRYTSILYYNRSLVLLDNFRSKMETIYDGRPKIYTNGSGVGRLAYHNVELAEFLKQKSNNLINEIENLSLECQRQFLKAFFDDEGSVDFRLIKNNKRRIKGYQHNKQVLELISRLLKNFDIKSKVDIHFNEIIISRRENIKKFAEEINFSKGLRINGNRSNSVWKKSLEKRKILANLLNSYQ